MNNIHCSLFTKKGFTLIEVLIALVITSIVVAALYSTFFLSREAVDAVDDSLLRLQEARTVIDVIKREIESAVYNSYGSGTEFTVFKLDDRDFYGKQASQLSFTSFSPLIPGVARIDYTVEENDGKLLLKKKIVSAYAQSVDTQSIELLEDVESFTVEAQYAGNWVKTWDSAASNSIPDEIRVSLSISAKRQKESGKDQSPSDSFIISDIAIRKTQ